MSRPPPHLSGGAQQSLASVSETSAGKRVQAADPPPLETAQSCWGRLLARLSPSRNEREPLSMEI